MEQLCISNERQNQTRKAYLHRVGTLAEAGTDSLKTQVATRSDCCILSSFAGVALSLESHQSVLSNE